MVRELEGGAEHLATWCVRGGGGATWCVCVSLSVCLPVCLSACVCVSVCIHLATREQVWGGEGSSCVVVYATPFRIYIHAYI